MSVNIHKIQAVSDFTIMQNRMMRDKRLSFRARGILGMMLTLPPDWETYASWIEDQGTEGREAVRASLKELERFGYLSRRKVRSENKFSGMEWEWRHTPEGGFPTDGFPSPEKPAATKKGSDKGKRSRRKEKKGVFHPRFPYPMTEDDLETLLTEQGVDYDPDHDGGFFDDMSKRGWTTPNGKPVYDVPAIYQARLDHNLPPKGSRKHPASKPESCFTF